MYLRESMEMGEQLAFMVTISHSEWEQAFLAGHEEELFDDWLLFIGQLATQMMAPEQRRPL